MLAMVQIICLAKSDSYAITKPAINLSYNYHALSQQNEFKGYHHPQLHSPAVPYLFQTGTMAFIWPLSDIATRRFSVILLQL